MLLNDVEKDIKIMCIEEGIGIGEFADKGGVSRQTMWKAVRGNVVVKSLISILEANGYDIKIEYIKRDSLTSSGGK